jgi:hypothetical protein
VTIVRIGATKEYSDGWEKAFGKPGKKSGSVRAAAKSAKGKKPAKKKPKRKTMK